MGEVLVATHRKRELSRYLSPPGLDETLAWVLIEGTVYLHKIEDFRVGFQRRLIGNLKVSPTTGANQIINQSLSPVQKRSILEIIFFGDIRRKTNRL
jgi:hypothetical protein